MRRALASANRLAANPLAGIDAAVAEQLLGEALASGGKYADLYFEFRRRADFVMEDAAPGDHGGTRLQAVRGHLDLWQGRAVGARGHPVSEITISINLDDLWKSIDGVGDELDTRSSVQSPSLRVSCITVAGM